MTTLQRLNKRCYALRHLVENEIKSALLQCDNLSYVAPEYMKLKIDCQIFNSGLFKQATVNKNGEIEITISSQGNEKIISRTSFHISTDSLFAIANVISHSL